jgi:hypothetical protein
MNRKALLIVLMVSAVLLVGALLHFRPVGTATPRLWALGFPEVLRSGGDWSVALLCLSNSTRHTITLEGSLPGLPFFTREVNTPAGWKTVDKPPWSGAFVNGHSWALPPEQAWTFHVPVVTNQNAEWRVNVRYYDGGDYIKLPFVTKIFRQPWKGSWKYASVSSKVLIAHQ